MKITRNTRIHWAGCTVGERMDQDAAFLRSIGIAAKDGARTLHECEEVFRENVRRVALNALDVAYGKDGWKDGDLPALFKGLDAHASILWERIGFPAYLKHGSWSEHFTEVDIEETA